MTSDAAQTIALEALAWLAGNDDLLPVFLGTTGASVEDLRAQASDPGFQVSLLEFLTMDDAWVIAFCDATQNRYEDPMVAAQVLAGADRRHWT